MATKARGKIPGTKAGTTKGRAKARPSKKPKAARGESKAAAEPKVARSPAPAKSPKKPSATPPIATPPPSGPRRAVFIDVENTSSEAALSRVLDELQLDLTNSNTEVTAIGNWRLASPLLGRSLARRGAALVHSAPAARVSDWSDLWIAVHAGIWLGRSHPGDMLQIVSHDRAFDAVGDAAARLGVKFDRLTYHGAGASPAPSSPASSDEAGRGPRGHRRSRRGRGRGAGSARAASPAPLGVPERVPASAAPRSSPPRGSAPAAPVARSARVSPPEAFGDDTPQGASETRVKQIIAQLAGTDPSHTVTLDALTVALKAAGFQRPPGSPRLVTRLRQMKGIEILPHSRLRLLAGAG